MKRNIVILDDLKDQSKYFVNLLTTANYQVFTAEEEYQLLDLINEKSPSIVIISATLKDKDVYLICKKIKLLGIGQNLPVIFINRDNHYFDAETMYNSGGADYINFPFSVAEILHKIALHIEKQTLKKDLEEKNNQLRKIIPHYQNLKNALDKAQLELVNIEKKHESSQLPSRDFLLKTLEKEWLRGARQRSDFGDVSETNISLILAKINDFELYQNNHERELIDGCLDIVIKTVNSAVKRPGDLVANFSLGTFAILLPNTDQEGANTVAEKVNQQLEELQIPHHYSEASEYLSFSFGIATGIPTQALSPQTLIEVAENAVASAIALKQGGEIVIDYF